MKKATLQRGTTFYVLRRRRCHEVTEVVVVTSPCTPWTKKGKPLHEEDKSKEAPPRGGQERKATFII
jgi:hypothetical protein